MKSNIYVHIYIYIYICVYSKRSRAFCWALGKFYSRVASFSPFPFSSNKICSDPVASVFLGLLLLWDTLVCRAGVISTHY